MASDKFRTRFLVTLALASLFFAAACSVQEKKEGDNKKVQIETPFGGLKVNTGVDAKDTGMKLYPGATPRTPSGDDKHSANVQLGNDKFGLKVVAAEYESQDTPDKILDFYRKELKSYGSVLECKNVKGDVNPGSIHENDKELKCNNSGEGNSTELKAGTSDRQRIVSVHPNGTGSRFALVYIQTRGNDDKI